MWDVLNQCSETPLHVAVYVDELLRSNFDGMGTEKIVESIRPIKLVWQWLPEDQRETFLLACVKHFTNRQITMTTTPNAKISEQMVIEHFKSLIRKNDDKMNLVDKMKTMVYFKEHYKAFEEPVPESVDLDVKVFP